MGRLHDAEHAEEVVEYECPGKRVDASWSACRPSRDGLGSVQTSMHMVQNIGSSLSRVLSLAVVVGLLGAACGPPSEGAEQGVDTDDGTTEDGGSSSGGTGTTGGSDGDDPACAEAQSRLESAAAAFAETHALPGVVMAASMAGCAELAAASGVANVETNEPMTVEHRLGLGSMTKSYVAALLLLLQEDGLVELDDSLSSFVSTSDVPDADVITIRQLLSHQSGIAGFQSNPTFVEEVKADPGRVWSPMELVQYAIEMGPTSPPGEEWHYSSTNYILAGLVAEQASGVALGEALRSRVLDPAGLEHTYFDGEETVSGPLARSYYMGMDFTGYPDPSWAWAAGSMVATAGDLLRWTEALFRGPLLSDGSKAQLGEWVETGLTPFEHYGLGVFLYELEAGTIVGHNGQIAGYTGAMGDRFATDELAVVLFNTSEGPEPLLGVDAALMALDGG